MSDGFVVWHNGHVTSGEPSGGVSSTGTGDTSIGAPEIIAMSTFSSLTGSSLRVCAALHTPSNQCALLNSAETVMKPQCRDGSREEEQQRCLNRDSTSRSTGPPRARSARANDSTRSPRPSHPQPCGAAESAKQPGPSRAEGNRQHVRAQHSERLIPPPSFPTLSVFAAEIFCDSRPTPWTATVTADSDVPFRPGFASLGIHATAFDPEPACSPGSRAAVYCLTRSGR